MKWLVALVTLIVTGGMGYVLSNKFIANANEQATYYQTMQVADDDARMKYLMKTSAGRAGINKAKITVVDSVKFDELKQSYEYIERTREEYTMHTETYATTDSNGKSTTHTRTYWSWDYAGSDSKRSKYVTVNGFKINASVIQLPQYVLKLKDTMFDKNIKYGMFFKHKGEVRNNYYYMGSSTRYRYSYTPSSLKMTVFARLESDEMKPLSDRSKIVTTIKTVKQVKEEYNNTAKNGQVAYIVAIAISLLLSIGSWLAYKNRV